MITIIFLYILLGIIAFIVILLHFSVRLRLSAASGEKPFIEVKWLFIKIYPRKPKEKKEKTKDKPQPKSEYTEAEIEELIRQAEHEDSLPELTDEEAAQLPGAETVETAADDDTALTETAQTESIESADDAEKKPDRKAKKEMKKRAKAEKAAAKSGKEKSEGGLAKLKRYADMVKPYVPMAWKAFRKILKTIRFTKLDIRLANGKEDAYDAALAYGKLNTAVYNGVAALGGVFTVQAKSVRVDCRFNENVFEYDVGTTVMVRPSTLIAIAFCVGLNFLRIFIPQKLRAWRERKRIERENKKSKKYNETELLTNE